MKTLIINGSTRANGDIAALLDEFTKHLEGEIRTVTWKDGISPCVDCRRCLAQSGCAIQDGMQEIYGYLEECDNVVLASPVWYSSLSGPALDIASRFQTLFAARFFRGEARPATKRGVIFLAGGQPGTESAPEKSARIILRNMGAAREMTDVIKSMDTDNVPARGDAAALMQARNAALKLNRPCGTEKE